MLTYFFHINYLPSIDLKSATGVLLGVAMAGVLTIASVAVLLCVPGALMQLCVRYRVINPGAEDLKKDERSKERKERKGNGRGSFILYTYASVAIALFLLFGPYYFGLTETFFGFSIMSVIIGISGVFLICVGMLVLSSHEHGLIKSTLRVRFRTVSGHKHGLWILGFLILFQIPVCAFLIQIFPFFRQDDDVLSLVNFGLAISLSCAFGIVVRHSWRSASLSLGAGLLLLIFLFDGLVRASDTVMRTLKLGNLENTTLLVSSVGCQVVTGTLGCGQCAVVGGEKAPVFHIQGIKVLSRIGEEYLLAFRKEQDETRFVLKAAEVLSIAYPAPREETLSSIPKEPLACVIVKEVSAPTVMTSK